MSGIGLKVRAGWVGGCVAAAALLAACDGPIETPVASEDLQNIDADLVTYGMVSYLSAGGVREGRVDADTAYMYQDSSNLRIVGMRVSFYDENGRDRATVVADRGELDQQSDRMVARGNVVLTIHADGRRIESAELNYDPNRDMIWSDSATVLTWPDGRVTRGSSFESDLEFRNVNVKNPRGAIGEIVF